MLENRTDCRADFFKEEIAIDAVAFARYFFTVSAMDAGKPLDSLIGYI